MQNASPWIAKAIHAVNIEERDRIRFWSFVNKEGPTPPHRPEIGNCWIWIGSKIASGYGKFLIGGRELKSHRLSFALQYGEIRDRIWALHKCDNPACVRPSHLFEGDHQANTADMVAKGRVARGIRHGQCGEKSCRTKMTAEKVLKMREIYRTQKISTRELGNLMGIAKSTAGAIINRTSWSHI